MNIVLAGMPASGKTTVSEIIAKKLGAPLLDTDALIVARHGNISEIFKNFGEEYFRDLETLAVKEACGGDGAVISIGGGCLMRGENAEILKRNGKIVYLKTEIKTLAERAHGDDSRPLLQGDAEEKLKTLFKLRRPVFEKYADITVVTDGISPEEVAEKILEHIK